MKIEGDTKTAKLFRNGRSQAVRLPAAFRFEGKEVFIRKNQLTGEVILSARPDNWESFFDIAKGVPDEFMADRRDAPPQKRKILR